jgi:hypothetical protein
MYTLETLIPDCVGRYITGPSGSVQLSNLINGRTYAKCWQAFVYWVVNQYDLGNSTNLAPIGILTRNNPQAKSHNGCEFRFLTQFLQKFEGESTPAHVCPVCVSCLCVCMCL